MNAEKQLRFSFDRLSADERTGVHHLALFGTLARVWKESKYASPFAINRQWLKEASKFHSVNACDQALQDLDKWEYLQYFPLRTAAHLDAAQRNTAQTSSAPEGLVRLNLPSILPSKVSKRRRPVSRVVMPKVISSQTGLFSVGENELIKPTVGIKIIQLAIQAIIQLVIALLNKHLDLF